MAAQQVVISSAEEADRALLDAAGPEAVVLEVVVHEVVPAWLTGVVRRARSVGAEVVVTLSRSTIEPTAETRAGWEIGVLTVVLGLGITRVEGVEPRRVHRVAAVIGALDAGGARPRMAP